MVNSYNKGTTVRLKATFTVGSVDTDPTTVTLKVKDPDGVVTSYSYPGSVSKLATGIFYKDLQVSNDGLWYYRFEGTGAVATVSEKSFEVLRSEF